MFCTPINHSHSNTCNKNTSPKSPKKQKYQSKQNSISTKLLNFKTMFIEKNDLIINIFSFLNVREMFTMKLINRHIKQNGNDIIRKAIISQLSSKCGSFDIGDLFRYAFRYPSPKEEEMTKMEVETNLDLEPPSLKRCRAFVRHEKDRQEEEALSILAPNLKNITELTEKWDEYIQNYHSLLANIGKQMNSLKSLSLSHGDQIGDKEYENLALNNSLNRISIAWCPDYALITLSKINSIQEIYLSNCKMSDQTIQHLIKLENLRILEITQSDSITHNTVQSLARCKNLTRINFKDCPDIATEESLKYFSDYLKLEALTIGYSPASKLTSRGIFYLSNCRNLKSLSITGIHNQISKRGFQVLAKLEDLNHLSLKGEGVTYEKIQTLAPNLLKLKSLDLKGCNLTGNEYSLLINQCPNLNSLCLWTSPQNEIDIKDVLINLEKQLLNLQRLKFSGLITTEGLFLLSRKCPNLFSIEIRSTNMLNGVLQLAKLEHLKELSIKCKYLSDSFLINLKNFRSLERLSLVYNSNVHHAIRKGIFHDMKNLKYLELINCNLKENDIKDLIKARSDLTIIVKGQNQVSARKFRAYSLGC